MPDYTISLVNSENVHPTDLLIQTIRETFENLTRLAGKQLVLETTTRSREVPDVDITFITRSPMTFGEQLEFGESGARYVHVGRLLNYRANNGPMLVYGNPRIPLRSQSRLDYTSQALPLFFNGEPELARAAGNIAIHELAHIIAAIEDNYGGDPLNFMSAPRSMRNVLGDNYRTRENLRRYWSCRRSFTPVQQQRLIDAIRSGLILSTITIQRGSNR